MVNLTTNKSSRVAISGKTNSLNGEHQLGNFAQNADKKFGAMVFDIANITTESMTSSREYVKENPIKGVDIAATEVGSGSLFTVAMRRQRD